MQNNFLEEYTYIYNIFVILSHGSLILILNLFSPTIDKIKILNFFYEEGEIFIFFMGPINWWKIWKNLCITYQNSIK